MGVSRRSGIKRILQVRRCTVKMTWGNGRCMNGGCMDGGCMDGGCKRRLGA